MEMGRKRRELELDLLSLNGQTCFSVLARLDFKISPYSCLIELMSSCEILDYLTPCSVRGDVIVRDPDHVVQKLPRSVQCSRGFCILDRFRSLAARDMRDLGSCK
jgi:hypothetical protein